MNRFRNAFFLLICLALPVFLGAQINQRFGKNRVQYHDFTWYFYESPHFVTYFDRSDIALGKFAMQVAEQDLSELQAAMEFRISQKINIVVYSDLTDLLMSNIGNDELFANTGGVTKIVDNKIFVYFDGSHAELRRQIREGLARVFLNNMLFGTNLQEIVQNAVLMNLPAWFTEGLVGFVAEEWNTELDDRLRDALLSGRYRTFSEFAAAEPRFAGHAMWYFIAQLYGRPTVSNLLYLTRINRSVESGFLYVTANTYEQIGIAWMQYFLTRYNLDENGRQFLPIGGDSTVLALQKCKGDLEKHYSGARLSPDGRYLAYASNNRGKFRVHLYDFREKKTLTVLKGGFRNPLQATDYGYPLLAWSPKGATLSVFYEKRDQIYLLRYPVADPKKAETFNVENLERILSVDCEDEKWYVLTAYNDGLTGIYRYAPTSGQRRLTSDFYDYRDAVCAEINGQKGVLFASNRPDLKIEPLRFDSILPLARYDLFFYNFDTARTRELVRITNTPGATERTPVAIDGRHFAFLSDENGIFNRQIGVIDTVFDHYDRVVVFDRRRDSLVQHADSIIRIPEAEVDTQYVVPVYRPKGFVRNGTDYIRGLAEHHYAPRSGRVAELYRRNGRFFVRVFADSLTAGVDRLRPTYFGGQVRRIPAPAPTPPKSEPPIKVVPQEQRVEAEEILLVDSFETDTPPPPVRPPVPVPPDTGKIDIDNYFFQSEFEEVQTPEPLRPDTMAPAPPLRADGQPTEARPIPAPQKTDQDRVLLPAQKMIRFHKLKPMPYLVRFRSEAITTQLDNSLLFGGMESVSATPSGRFGFPPPGILLKTTMRDVFEDYRIELGARIPTTFNGMEYFIVFDNLRKRLDKRFAFYRKGASNTYVTEGPAFLQTRIKTVTHLGLMELSYPFDAFRSLRGQVIVRDDKRIFKATDTLTLEAETYSEQRLGVRLEYVFDNVVQVMPNIFNGSRYKVYGEFYNRFRADVANGFHFDPSLGTMGVLGFDARHYQRLDRLSIFAVRGAGAFSFGSEKMLYFLGGTENWLNNKFDNDIPVPTEGFAYQTVAANLRGFASNIRNGSSYLLINAELRVPVFNYLSKKTLKSPFLRNFQLTAFCDVGSAWTGFSPFRNDNPLNTYTSDNPFSPVQVTVRYFRQPIVMGYGLGVRSMLFGYFVRLDYAWGVETGKQLDPLLHVSIGYDF